MFFHWHPGRTVNTVSRYPVTITGTPGLVSGRFENAIAPNSGGVSYNTGTLYTVGPQYTVEFWLYAGWSRSGKQNTDIITMGSSIYNATIGTDWHTLTFSVLNVGDSNAPRVTANLDFYVNQTYLTGSSIQSSNLTVNAWNHIVFNMSTAALNNDVWRLRQDGGAGSTVSQDYGAVNATVPVLDIRDLTINDSNNTYDFTGLAIDELRISNNWRYGSSGTYTVPTAAFEYDVNTLILAHMDTESYIIE